MVELSSSQDNQIGDGMLDLLMMPHLTSSKYQHQKTNPN